MKTKEINKLFNDYYEKNKTIMTLDGVVDEKDENILFVLKESNTGNSKEADIEEFWFKNVFFAKIEDGKGYYEPMGKSLTPSEKGKQTTYYNCITKIRDMIGKEYGIFYININKGGGGKNSDGKGVKKWLTDKEKSDFLIRQISILEPNKVVVFSAYTIGNKIIDILNSSNVADENIIRMPFHPSRYSNKSIKEILGDAK